MGPGFGLHKAQVSGQSGGQIDWEGRSGGLAGRIERAGPAGSRVGGTDGYITHAPVLFARVSVSSSGGCFALLWVLRARAGVSRSVGVSRPSVCFMFKWVFRVRVDT